MTHAQVLSAKEFKANPVAVLNKAESSSVIITKGKKKFAVMELVEADISEQEHKLLMEARFESSIVRFLRQIRHYCF